MSKRFVCLVLLSCLLCANACTSDETTPEETNALIDVAVEDTLPAETEFTLPERNYEGKTFTFITAPDIVDYLHREELNGDAVNDAMLDTEVAVEELYNVKMETVVVSTDSCTIVESDFVPAVLAGDSYFNAAYANCVYLANVQTKGVYKNLYDVEAFDFTKPWWLKNSVEAMTVGDQMYLGNSSISCSAFARSHVIYVNKNMAEDYSMEIPYTSVKDGKWTLDKLISLTGDIYVDTNGDGQKDAGDQYGMAGCYWSNHWALASGYNVITKTGDADVLKIDIDIEKMSTLVDTIYSWFFEKTGSFIEYDPVPTFMNGNALFSEGMVLDAVNRLRNSEVEYAILPYPKYSENQDTYYTYTQGWLFVLPNLESDEDFDGSVLEALAYYRHRDLIPAYYEITVKGKIADAQEDAEMLDIVYNTMTETFDRCYDAYHGMQIVLNMMIPEHNRDFASWHAGILPSAEAKLQDLAVFYQENQ